MALRAPQRGQGVGDCPDLNVIKHLLDVSGSSEALLRNPTGSEGSSARHLEDDQQRSPAHAQLGQSCFEGMR